MARIPRWRANYERYLQAPEAIRQDLLELYKTTPKNPFAQEVRKNGLLKNSQGLILVSGLKAEFEQLKLHLVFTRSAAGLT